MNQFDFHHERSKELKGFSHIRELAIRKNASIQHNSLGVTASKSIRIYCILDGKFEWVIADKLHILYPGDVAIVLPEQTFRGNNDYMDVGMFCMIEIAVKEVDANRKMVLGDWSGLSESEGLTISKILQLNNIAVLVKLKEAFPILQSIQFELQHQEIGYVTRVNQLIDELLIRIARHSTHQTNLRRDFPQTFMKLEEALRQNLSHQWTVEEMAALTGLGTTAFSEKVKSYTGFSPLNYLINIRITEATKLLKKQGVNITEIALDTGFYSSQHFSTTFKKLTGYTPGEFRKRNNII